MAQTGQDWHLEDIKAALRKRFGTLRDFSRTLALHPNGVSNALRFPDYSSKTELRIASALNVAPHVLWPERWAVDGTPLQRTGKRNATARANPPDSQKKAAA